MKTDPKDRETADRILKAMEAKFGFVPLVYKTMSERPDVMIPAAGLGKAVLETGNLEQKTRYLLAIGASSALGAPFCISVQMDHAIRMGATKEEILEAMLIGSYMAMNKGQSYAFRELEKRFPPENKTP